jgi:hypothetical protein
MNVSCGSAVSIVSDYILDDWTTGVWPPAEAQDFSSSLCVQKSPEAHSVSHPMGIGNPFTEGKAWPGHDTDHSSTVKVKNEELHSLPCCLYCGSGTALLFYFTLTNMNETQNGYRLPDMWLISVWSPHRIPVSCSLVGDKLLDKVKKMCLTKLTMF